MSFPILLRIGVHVIQGRFPALRRELLAARGVPSKRIREVYLQTLLFTALSRVIRAFDLLEEIRGAKEAEPEGDPWAGSRKGGRHVFETVYGGVGNRLSAKLRRQHPALEASVREHAYGLILSRGGLDLRRREMLTIGFLALLGEWPAYESHLAGACRTGVKKGDVERVLVGLEGMATKKRLSRARAIARERMGP